MSGVLLGTFVRQFAATSSARELKFLVIRNYQSLPDKNVGTDIDLLVSASCLPEWRAVLESCTRPDFLLNMGDRRHYVQRCILGGPRGEVLVVDLICALVWRGVEWLSVVIVFEQARRFRDDIWIPHPAHECVITFCHSYLYGGHIKDKYIPLMSEQVRKHTDEVLGIFARIFGRRVGREVVSGLLMRDVSRLRRNATKNRIQVLVRGFFRRPLPFVYNFVLSYLMDFRVRFFPARRT